MTRHNQANDRPINHRMFEQSDEITLAAIEKRPFAQELRSAGMLLMGELA